MGLLEIVLIGIGLSMDAVAVSMSNGMVYRNMSRGKELAMPVFFGFFQGLMPFIGFFAGGLFAQIISKYAGIVILLILGMVGGKMVWDGIKNKSEEVTGGTLTLQVLFFQAIATSIDAFAVGVGFSAVQIHILPAVLVIGVTTFICSFLAILIGKKFGNYLGNKAEILGGVILIAIGIKAVLS
ncbi:MAG: manganese efflux pump MntP family protein [Anaerovorax sp.]